MSGCDSVATVRSGEQERIVAKASNVSNDFGGRGTKWLIGFQRGARVLKGLYE
jgi:hypothetical protein